MSSVRLRTAIVVIAAAIVASALGCARGPRMVAFQPTQQTLLAQASAPEDVRAAIVAALQRRRFTPLSDAPGMMTASREDRRGLSLQVQIVYDAQRVEITHVTSGGFARDEDPETGAPRIERAYASLMVGLSRSVEQELEAIHASRRDALQQQRDHELRLADQRRRAAEADAQAQYLRSQPVPEPEPAYAAPTYGQLPIPPGMIPTPNVAPVQLQGGAQVGSSQQSFTCCVNGRYYECPGRDAFQQCARSGPSACERMPQHDGRC